jgi:hypothetical protein
MTVFQSVIIRKIIRASTSRLKIFNEAANFRSRQAESYLLRFHQTQMSIYRDIIPVKITLIN